jgi:hypothetical protein
MRIAKVVALLVLIAGFALFTRNNAHAIGRRAHPILAAFQAAPGSGTALQIVAPKPGQKISNDAVTIHYVLRQNVSVQSIPNYQVQLDAKDPVTVPDTSYMFTGLQPGTHTVTVQLLDANSNPVPNTLSQVQFTVEQPGAAQHSEESLVQASTLPEPGNDALSLLGIIGFGVLVGGALSLYRNRQTGDHT